MAERYTDQPGFFRGNMDIWTSVAVLTLSAMLANTSSCTDPQRKTNPLENRTNVSAKMPSGLKYDLGEYALELVLHGYGHVDNGEDALYHAKERIEAHKTATEKRLVPWARKVLRRAAVDIAYDDRIAVEPHYRERLLPHDGGGYASSVFVTTPTSIVISDANGGEKARYTLTSFTESRTSRKVAFLKRSDMN